MGNIFLSNMAPCSTPPSWPAPGPTCPSLARPPGHAALEGRHGDTHVLRPGGPALVTVAVGLAGPSPSAPRAHEAARGRRKLSVTDPV